jgi:hypothetical protein
LSGINLIYTNISIIFEMLPGIIDMHGKEQAGDIPEGRMITTKNPGITGNIPGCGWR